MRFLKKNVRSSRRHAVKMSCQVVRERDFKLIGTTTLDISPDGMLVLSNAYVEKGDDLIISFQATELGLHFDTDAKVARVVKGKRPTDKGRSIGIRFGSLSKVQRMILRGTFRKVPPPLPARERPIDYAATVLSI